MIQKINTAYLIAVDLEQNLSPKNNPKHDNINGFKRFVVVKNKAKTKKVKHTDPGVSIIERMIVGLKVENVAIDRINLRIEKVKIKEFEELVMALKFYAKGDKLKVLNDLKEDEDDLFHIRELEKLGGTDYRYNLYLSEGRTSDGAVYVGYKHNSARLGDTYDLKVELNPSKCNKAQDSLLKALHHKLSDKVVRLVEFDVAIDIQHRTSNVYIINKSGKLPSSYDTTRYFGQKHTNGYLKMYDKLKEQRLEISPTSNVYIINKSGKLPSSYDTTRYFGQKHTNGYLKMYDKLKEQRLEISPKGSLYLTRIEFTLRPNDNTGLIYKDLEKYKFNLDKCYDIGLLDGINDITVKCMALALTHGHIKRSELPRKQKEEIKSELDKIDNKLTIDKLLNDKWESLLDSVSDWFGLSKNYTKNYALFGTEQRDLTEEEQLLFESFLDFNNKKEHKKRLHKELCVIWY